MQERRTEPGEPDEEERWPWADDLREAVLKIDDKDPAAGKNKKRPAPDRSAEES